jgi:putative spermidine/putrescine transport system permease protein
MHSASRGSFFRRLYLRVCIAAVWVARALALLLFFVPLALVIWVSFSGDAATNVPPSSYSLQWYRNIASVRELYDGLLTSLKIAAVVVPTSLLIGTLAAYGQWRHPLLSPRAVETILSLPILVPLVVTGLALLNVFSTMGLYSGFWNITLAHVIVTFPFVVRFVFNILSRYNLQLDEAAQSLGASPLRVFRHVTLPLMRPSLFAGGLFAFVLSFDDFGVTIFLVDTNTITLPVAMYQYMEWNLDPTLSAMSALLVVAAVAVTVICERLVGLDRFVGIQN